MKTHRLRSFLYLTVLLHSQISHATETPDRFLGPRDIPGIKALIESYLKQDNNIFHYGNWYPELTVNEPDSKKSGNNAPVDSLDYIAQKHNFAYQIAEQQGKIYGIVEARRLKVIADYLLIRDAKALPENPKQWTKPPTDIKKAARYRDRMITGFSDTTSDNSKTIEDNNLGWATSPIENWDVDTSHQIKADEFEKQITQLQNAWNDQNSSSITNPNNNKPLEALVKKVNEAVNTDTPADDTEQKSARNKKTDIVRQANTEPKEINSQKLENAFDYIDSLHPINAIKSLVNNIKRLESRIPALNQHTKNGYDK
jgi:hypothetical protein